MDIITNNKMVSKYIFLLDKEKAICDSPLISYTDDLYTMLNDQKNVISDFYMNKKWDKFKKQNNQFELIFTNGNSLPSLSSYIPISRSFFKQWEILHDFKDLPFLKQSNVKALFMAEGPGGFIEAFTKYRCDATTMQCDDELYGITLISDDKCVPNWKLSDAMKTKYNIKLLSGKDKTGSLYNNDNINDYIEKIGKNSCEYITADGGFDFSNNFNSQEGISLQLIKSEIELTMQLQKKGGVFLLKIYDISLEPTKELIFKLYCHYEKLYFIKPITSRPANSEKYILCVNFQDYKEECFDSFCQQLDEFNNIFFIKQIININTSLASINCNQHFMDTLKDQIKKSIKWLHKYEIQLDKKSILFYKKLLKM